MKMINMNKILKLIIINIIKFQNVKKMHHKIKLKKNIKIQLKKYHPDRKGGDAKKFQ